MTCYENEVIDGIGLRAVSGKMYENHFNKQCQSECITLDQQVLGHQPICPICAESSAENGIIPEDLYCCQMPTCLHLNHFSKPNQIKLFASPLVDMNEMRNSKFDGYCDFPVSLNSFDSSNSIILDFHFCAFLENHFHLYQIIQARLTLCTTTL